ncbi:hypothetical protein CAEBREN_12381 [Caenorhabditis brenneri]|uniref:Uncharacterized protein n=1 Tax=Caenorhabditis brenneri TaxID=135651 RepID=G0NGE1_CAEBE|nr:hypothetical protein CAEBREN_12381 [Caenorhabditis brenneri]
MVSRRSAAYLVILCTVIIIFTYSVYTEALNRGYFSSSGQDSNMVTGYSINFEIPRGAKIIFFAVGMLMIGSCLIFDIAHHYGYGRTHQVLKNSHPEPKKKRIDV